MKSLKIIRISSGNYESVNRRVKIRRIKQYAWELVIDERPQTISYNKMRDAVEEAHRFLANGDSL